MDRSHQIQLLAFLSVVFLGLQMVNLQDYQKPISIIASHVSTTATTAIISLTRSTTKDIDMLCHALHTLKYLPDARKSNNTQSSSGPPLAPVIVFHERQFPNQSQAMLEKCTPRPMTFAVVDFDSYPPAFDATKEEALWRVPTAGQKRRRFFGFGYSQMIRFYVTTIWKHPAIQGYETIMRLDTDACWRPSTPQNEENYPPYLPSDKVYHANIIREDSPQYCQGIYELTKQYIAKTNMTVANPRMWRWFGQTYRKSGHCLSYYNNFEVVRVKFMQQSHVQHFHHAVTEQAPFGVFRHRWGDAIVRYLTMTLFAEPGSVIHTNKWRGNGPKGYAHKRECPRPNPNKK